MGYPARPWSAPWSSPRHRRRRDGDAPLFLRVLAWPLVLAVISSGGLFLYSMAFLQLTGWADIAGYWAAGLISAKLWLEDFLR